MRPMRSPLRRTSAREDGFTLVETVAASVVGILVLTTVLSVFLSAQRSENFQQGRAQGLDEIRLAMERMTKEIRQVQTVRAGSSASVLDVDTFVEGTATHVIYRVTGTDLTRTEGSSTITLVTQLIGSSMFTYTPSATSPSVITVTIRSRPTPNAPETTLVLTSEIKLRNAGG